VVGGEISPRHRVGEEARPSLAPMRHNCTDPAEDRQAVGGSKQKSEISFHKSVSLSEPSVWSLTLSLSLFCIFMV
jgi:hypothetical protein